MRNERVAKMMKMGTFRTVALTVSIMCGNPMLPGDNNDIGMQCPGGNDLLPLVSDVLAAVDALAYSPW